MSVVIVPRRRAAQAIVTRRGPRGPAGPDTAEAMDALRTDLATNGAPLIGFSSAAPNAVARTLDKKVGEIISIADWGVPGGLAAYQPGVTEKIQAALDEAPIGCTLLFPSGIYYTDDTLRQTRQMNILMESGAAVVSVFSDVTKNVFEIVLEEAAGGGGDARRMHIENAHFNVAEGYAAKHTLHVKNAAPLVGNLQMFVTNSYIGALNTQTGKALHIEGVATQGHTFLNNHIRNGVHLDGAADGCSFMSNLVDGYKTAFLLNLAPGAMKTRILNNLLVARDGAVDVFAGSQVDIRGNQIEQTVSYGANANDRKSSIIVRGSTYGSRGVVIDGNNFGGGIVADGNAVDYSVYVEGDVESLTIGKNAWGLTNAADIKIADAAVRYTSISFDQQLRGTRGSAAFTVYPAYAANSDNVLQLLDIEDSGTGTAGVFKDATALGGASQTALVNGTCTAGLRFYKDPNTYRVHFTGGHAILSTTAVADMTLGTFPAGFRPSGDYAAGTAVGLDLGGGKIVPQLIVTSAGVLTIDKPATTGSAWIPLDGFSFLAKRDGYAPGY